MKKIYLLPCVLFLALTGCKSNKNSNKSDKERTEPLTEAEIIELLTTGSYTVDITDSYYDEGEEEEADVIEYRLLKEGLKFESQQFVEEEESDHFEPVAYLDIRDVEHLYEFRYYENYEDWARYEITEEDLEEIYEEIFIEVDFINKFVGVQEATWGLNNNVYHGELLVEDENKGNHTYIIDVKVTTQYVEDILVQIIDEDKFHEDYHFVFSKWDATVVELPYTLEQLFEEMVRYDEKTLEVASYRESQKIEQVIEGETQRVEYVTECVDDEENRTTTLRAIGNGENQDTFVQYVWNSTTYDYYFVDQSGDYTKQVVDSMPREFSYYFVAMDSALNNFVEENDIETFRGLVDTYQQLDDGFEFSYKDTSAPTEETVTLEVHVNAQEYLTSLALTRVGGEVEGTATLTFSNHNKVTITLPTI